MNRATLTFQSENGNEYLFDDITGNILPWGQLEEAILKQECGIELTDADRETLRHSTFMEIAAKTDRCRLWRSQYGAFFRPEQGAFPSAAPQDLERYIWSNTLELILVVTENCNLKCRYCSFASGAYLYNRKPSKRMMSYSRAIKAVDWYAKNLSAAMARNPRKKYGISFYGGEPLLNIDLIDRVLQYAEKTYPGVFFPLVTTNGLLLTPENVEILKRHSVHVALSIDGPADEHDRLRVDLGEKGTHGRIMQNLAAIKERHPEYWKENLVVISVYDPLTDLKKCSQFFDDNQELIPRCIFANMVNGHNTEYYSAITRDHYLLFNQRMETLRKEFKQMLIEGNEPGSYLTSVTGQGIYLEVLRLRADDRKPPILPYTGCCIPGGRMTVNVDGNINMCERVNGTYPIGNLDEGGLDSNRASQLLREYQEKIMYKCDKCPITRLCYQCFAFCETEGGVVEPPDFCESTLHLARHNLADYVSVIEAKPDLQLGIKERTLRHAELRILLQS